MKRVLCVIMVLGLMLAAMSVPTVTAAENNTALLSYLAGDVNGDWTVSTADVRDVLAALVKDLPLSVKADANGDGAVDSADATYMLRTAIGAYEANLIKPAITQVDTPPEGETVAFSERVDDYKYGDDYYYVEDAWIVQSFDEWKASFNDSNSRKDYTAEYAKEFFEDNAVLIWFSPFVDGGLASIKFNRLVKNGSELCMIRTLEYRGILPFYTFRRFFIEVSKEDLIGIETVSFASECVYRED